MEDEALKTNVFFKGVYSPVGYKGSVTRFVAILFCFPVFISAIIPSILYRWSLKATTIIYLPFLWVISTAFRKIKNLTIELKKLRTGDLSRLVTGYSVFVLALFLAKVALMVSWNDFADWVNGAVIGQFASIYIVPKEIPIWQLVSFVNALLAIGLFLFAGAQLFSIKHGEPRLAPSLVEKILRTTTFVRGTLTLYTIACTLYITVRAASDWDLPQLGTKWFPWL